MNKNTLRENIMQGIKRSLNEAFTFDSDPVGDDILKVISSNQNIANVVKDANEEDWTDLINKIKEIANTNMTNVKAPSKITNINSLANTFISKMDITNVNIIKKMDDEAIKDLIEYLNSEEDETFESKDVKECGGSCTENEDKACPKCGKTPCVCNKEVKESRAINRRRRLNESSRDEKLAQLYQVLCNAQDLAEDAGEIGIMYDIQDIRYAVERIRFGR